MFSVIIVGGGVAGASAAYHLINTPNFKGKILLIEAGEIGRGVGKEIKLENNEIESQFSKETTMSPWNSGTITLDNPCRVKMIITSFATTAENFIKHHGKKGLALSNILFSTGRDLQIKLANSLISDGKKYDMNSRNEIPDENGVAQLGSLLMCEEHEVEKLKQEFELLKEGGFEVEWFDKNKIEENQGTTSKFHAGIYFPKDGIIDSIRYTKKLLDTCKTNFPNQIQIMENSHVNEYKQQSDKTVKVFLDDGREFTSEKLVLSTGGLFLNDINLFGILFPCYSYLLGVPNIKSNDSKDVISNFRNTPNYLTYGFIADWAITQGQLRISGEDHFSGLKPPRTTHRCMNMKNYISDKYPHFNKIDEKDLKFKEGILTETPDFIPLVGKLSEDSSIIYFLGCNGWGQAVLSGVAPMIPILLEARKASKIEQELLNFIDIKRFKKTQRTYLKKFVSKF